MSGDWPFLKWFPFKSRSSSRWRRLPLVVQGLHRHLYDLAGTCKPRGKLYEANEPMSDEALAEDARIPVEEFRELMQLLRAGKEPFITQDANGAYEFPLWNKHQDHGPLRRRGESGEKVGKNRGTDKDKEEDKDKEKETGFDRFWAAYPRKTGKKAAEKAWLRAKDKPELKVLLATVEAQKASEQWTKDGGQYVPNPATWLNQGRWGDEVVAGSAKGRERMRLDAERSAREAQYAAFAKVKPGDKASGPEGVGVVGDVRGTSISVKVDGYGWTEIRDLATFAKWTFTRGKEASP